MASNNPTLRSKVTRRAGRPRTYSGLAACAFGPRAATLVKLIQHVFLAGAIVAVQLTAARALQQVFAYCGWRVCLVTVNVLVALVMLQIRPVTNKFTFDRPSSLHAAFTRAR